MSHSNTDSGRIVIYTSCAWRHGTGRAGLRGLLRNKWRLGVDYADLSVSPRGSFQWDDQDLDIARQIKERVQEADVFVAFGATTPDDDMWVELELSFAERMGKPVIVIAPYQNAASATLPNGLEGRAVTSWATGSVRNAIWKALPDAKRNAFFDRLCEEHRHVKEVRAAMFTQQVESMLDAHGRPKAAPGARRKLPGLANDAAKRQHMTGRFLLGASELAAAHTVQTSAQLRLRHARRLTNLTRGRLREGYARAILRAARRGRAVPGRQSGAVRRFVDAANGLMAQERYRRIIEAQQAAAANARSADSPVPTAPTGVLDGFLRRSTDLAKAQPIRA